MPFVFRRKTLVAAWEEVRRNHGAPGVDGESVEKFSEHAKTNLWELSEAIRTGRWRPKPLRRVFIPKPDGSKRGIGIPCVRDRIVHGAVAKVAYAMFEDEFGPDCYAYVKGRSALDAVQRVQQEGRSGKEWILETDIKSFFDRIDRQKMVDKLAVRIADGSFLRLVTLILRSGVLGEMAGEDAVGIPQGSPLSPILANIFLADFDRGIGKRHALVRYADDAVVLCATEEEARAARDEVETALREEGLEMKPEKTRVVPLTAGVEFLGYRMTAWKVEPSAKSVRKFQESVRSLTVRHETRPLVEVIRRVMPVVRGWSNYFRLVGKSRTIWDLGFWLLARLKSYHTKHRWMGKWRTEAPTSMLYGLGLRLPSHIIDSFEF